MWAYAHIPVTSAGLQKPLTVNNCWNIFQNTTDFSHVSQCFTWIGTSSLATAFLLSNWSHGSQNMKRNSLGFCFIFPRETQRIPSASFKCRIKCFMFSAVNNSSRVMTLSTHPLSRCLSVLRSIVSLPLFYINAFLHELNKQKLGSFPIC